MLLIVQQGILLAKIDNEIQPFKSDKSYSRRLLVNDNESPTLESKSTKISSNTTKKQLAAFRKRKRIMIAKRLGY